MMPCPSNAPLSFGYDPQDAPDAPLWITCSVCFDQDVHIDDAEYVESTNNYICLNCAEEEDA